MILLLCNNRTQNYQNRPSLVPCVLGVPCVPCVSCVPDGIAGICDTYGKHGTAGTHVTCGTPGTIMYITTYVPCMGEV